jgi:hypothetical protein
VAFSDDFNGPLSIRRRQVHHPFGQVFWSTTFHTYGLLITPVFTVYYFDNIEVFRHPSGEISSADPFFFLLNLAIGGCWLGR